MVTDREISLYTQKQLSNIYQIVEEIIDTLPDKALNELLQAYQGDLDSLFMDLTRQVNFVVNHNASGIDAESLSYQNEFRYHVDQQLKKHVFNYFTTTVLSNFDNHYRTVEWGNMIQKYPWSAYLCQRGSGKSLIPSELVVMYDGTYKQIKDIVVGDLVMGIDSTPRKVLSTHSGRDTMYCIEQVNAENYTTNSEHILHYKRGGYEIYKDKKNTTRWKMIFDEDHTQIVEMSTKEFHKQSRLYKSQSFGYRVKGWELPEREQKIEPYYIGLWLGDGHSANSYITNIDIEVIEYLQYIAKEFNCELTTLDKYTYRFLTKNEKSTMSGVHHPLYKILLEYNLINNKHIPDNYLLGSRKQRLELLAGLIDSDGTTSANKSSYSISQKNKALLEQIQRLCWSLGFRANLKERQKKLKYKNNEIYTSYELHFSGDVWDIPCKIKRKRIEKYDRVQDSQRSKLDSKYLGVGEYCGFECDGDKLFLLKDGTVVHNSYAFCYAFPLWRLYSYDPPLFLMKDTIDNKNRKETCLITNTFTLVKDHAKKIVEEIQRNPILSEKLVDKSSSLGKDQITTKTGSVLHLRSKDSMIRGLHVGASVTDDFLDKSAIYSKEQRDKFHEIFYAETKNIVEQGGYNLVSGTPFHVQDLYGDLKQDPMFKVFEYPGIFPNGDLLAPDRFSFKYLMDLKRSLGSIIFAREVLVTPVSDASSLFPWAWLERSFIGMENISFVDNISSYPFRMKKVVIGCDFAKSANIGADFTVFAVVGVDTNDNYHIIQLWRKQGASANEMVNKLVQMDQMFRPNKIICEANGFQSLIPDMVKQRGLKNIEEFVTTGSNKKDLYSGLPSLSAIFERGEIKIPYSSKDDTRDLANIICGEFNSISFNEDTGKLESADQHDDCAMANFIAITSLRQNNKTTGVYYV